MPGYYLIVVILHSRDIANTAELTISEGYRKLDDDILYVHFCRYARGETTYRCCLHLYYNLTRWARAINAFNEALFEYRQKVESGKPAAAQQQAFDKYLIVKTTLKRGGDGLFSIPRRENTIAAGMQDFRRCFPVAVRILSSLCGSIRIKVQ
jgi:hypothetical protein